MKEEKDDYRPIDYRIKGDLASMKRNTKTNYNKIFYSLLTGCLAISLLSLFLLNSSNNELKESNAQLKESNAQLKETNAQMGLQIMKSGQIIDSLSQLNQTLKRNGQK